MRRIRYCRFECGRRDMCCICVNMTRVKVTMTFVSRFSRFNRIGDAA